MNPITHLLVGWSVAESAALSRRDRALVAIAGVAPSAVGAAASASFLAAVYLAFLLVNESDLIRRLPGLSARFGVAGARVALSSFSCRAFRLRRKFSWMTIAAQLIRVILYRRIACAFRRRAADWIISTAPRFSWNLPRWCTTCATGNTAAIPKQGPRRSRATWRT